MTKKKNTAAVKELRENEKKWGQASIRAGWTMLPSILLEKQHALGLDPIDINLILQIVKHWWRAAEKPFPSHKRLAEQMNIDVSTVKRHLKSLQQAGLVDWEQRRRADGGRSSNVYDFSGLVEHVNRFAKEELKERDAETDARKARSRRKRATKAKPKLTLVKDEGADD